MSPHTNLLTNLHKTPKGGKEVTNLLTDLLTNLLTNLRFVLVLVYLLLVQIFTLTRFCFAKPNFLSRFFLRFRYAKVRFCFAKPRKNQLSFPNPLRG